MDDQMLHHFMEDLMPIIVIPTMVVATAYVAGLIVAAFKDRAHLRAQTEFHNRMMDKFSSADDFTAYLQSDAGRRFFENLSSEPVAPLAKILGSIQKGAVLTLLAVGLFFLCGYAAMPDGGNVMFIVATIVLMIGLGFLVSAAISYRLSKTWGLISIDNKQAAGEPKPWTS